MMGYLQKFKKEKQSTKQLNRERDYFLFTNNFLTSNRLHNHNEPITKYSIIEYYNDHVKNEKSILVKLKTMSGHVSNRRLVPTFCTKDKFKIIIKSSYEKCGRIDANINNISLLHGISRHLSRIK